MKKPMWWASNSIRLLSALGRQCSGQHQHVRVEGSRTWRSQEYPHDLARAVAEAVREHARVLEPGRLATRRATTWHVLDSTSNTRYVGRDVFYLDACTDSTEWQD